VLIRPKSLRSGLNVDVQSVLMCLQDLRPGLYAPTCPPYYATVCKVLYSIQMSCAFSVWLQFFVIVLTSIDSCTYKCNHCSFKQTTTGTSHLQYNTIYCYRKQELTEKSKCIKKRIWTNSEIEKGSF